MKAINNKKAINWQTFKDMLLQHPNLYLQFRYAQGKLVNAAYHITEIKQAAITSVDCGGVKNVWTEIVLQLWVPETAQQARSMKVSKAIAIINTVEKMLHLNPNGIVKIEYGSAAFDTRQMLPNEMIADGEHLRIDLNPDVVQCKAISNGSTCGPKNPKVQLAGLSTQAHACCRPGGGCCS